MPILRKERGKFLINLIKNIELTLHLLKFTNKKLRWAKEVQFKNKARQSIYMWLLK